MTANVTSIARVRAAARDRAELLKINNRTATTLLVLVVVLVVIGLGATQSASSAVAIDQGQDRFFFFKRQLFGVGIGTIALLITSRIPYGFYRRLAVPAFVAAVGLLVAVLAMGPVIGGAQRWLYIGQFSFQPSELAKVSVIVILAYLLEKKHKLLTTFGHFVVPVVFTVGVVGGLVMLQPDLGTTIIIGAAAMAVILASDAPFKFVLLLSVMVVGVAWLLAFSDEYRVDRIAGFLDPWGNASGDGYQLIQGYYALSNGGIFGVGLGASRARWFYLPNAHTDFIFAIIGEEVGLLGCLLVVALFVAFGALGTRIALRAPDRFGMLLAAGVTVWVVGQAAINIGGVVGLLPVSGIPLPFVSFGGSALVFTMAGAGLLGSVARRTS